MLKVIFLTETVRYPNTCKSQISWFCRVSKMSQIIASIVVSCRSSNLYANTNSNCSKNKQFLAIQISVAKCLHLFILFLKFALEMACSCLPISVLSIKHFLENIGAILHGLTLFHVRRYVYVVSFTFSNKGHFFIILIFIIARN